MKPVIVLFSLIGCALALAPGKQYTYKYTGRIGMGIPEIRNKVSGTGIKSDVVFQVKNGGKAIVKFTNIEVGEYVGDVDCGMQNAMPIQYSPLKGEAKMLEEPFEVHLKSVQDDVMIVPKSDREWLVNMRKSVALMFFMEPLKMNFETYRVGTPFPTFFTKMEPTIYGTCSCEYTMVPLTSDVNNMEKEMIMKNMNEDIEKNMVVEKPMYRMTRSVDFDNCEDKVALVHAAIGNLSETPKGQFANMMNRMSVATYNLVGEPGNFRIQTGFVQGSIATYPFGTNTEEKVITISNQTLSLYSVTEMKTPLTMTDSTRTVKTWLMEVASPFAPSSNPVPWINYYSLSDAAYAPMLPENIVTGIPITDNDVMKFKVQLDTIIKEVATRMLKVGEVPNEKIDMFNTNEAVITTLLDTATKVVPGIDVQNLQQLFDNYYNDKSEIGQMQYVVLLDVCAASGAGAPIKFLINNFKNGKITNERIATIFVTLTNHFTAVPLIPDIIEYLKTLDLKEKPFLTTLVFTNFAKTINKFCIDKDSVQWSTPFQIFGKDQCDTDKVYDEIMRIFKNKLDNANTSWERMVILQAIGKLGSPKSLEVFKTFITGDFDITVKRPVIYSLTPDNLGEVAREDVFNMLMPVLENVNADSYLRQITLATLLTWNPSPAFWQRLVVLSWKEPSPNMGAYIYQVMKATAYVTEPYYQYEVGSKIARTLLPFTKPYSQSPKYSYHYFAATRDPVEYISSYFNKAILKNDITDVPHEIFYSLFTTYGESLFKFIEFALYNDDHTTSKMNTMDNIMNKVTKIIPEEMKNIINSGINRHTMNEPIMPIMENMMEKATLLIEMFDNTQVFAPINFDIIAKAFGKDGLNIINTWLSGTKLHLTKYFDATPMEIFTPTELGLPFFARYSQPILSSAIGNTKLTVAGKTNPTIFDIINMNNVGLEFESNYKFAQKVTVNFRTIVPYTKKTISTGVESLKNVNIPGKFTINMTYRNNIRNVTFDFVPQTTSAYPVINFQNVPYVLRKSMYPGEHYTKIEKFEVVTIKDDMRGQTKEIFPLDKTLYGVNGYVHYEGDVSYPYTFGNVLHLIKKPVLTSKLLVSPSPKLWSTVIVVDFGKSETKSIKTSLAFMSPYTTTTNTKLTEETLITKPKKPMNVEGMSFLYYFNLLLEGTVNRFYETDIYMKTTESQIKQDDLFFTFTRNAIPQYNVPSMEYCLKLTATTPAINDIDTLLKFIKNGQMSTQYSGVLRGGKSCSDRQLATLKGQLKVSDVRKNHIVKELEETCKFNQNSPVTSFKTAPVYDELTFRVDFKQPFPVVAQNTTYQLFDVIRGYNFPHVYTNYLNVKNQPNVVFLRGNRLIGDKTYNIRVELPTETVDFDKFYVPLNIVQIVPLVY